MRFTIERLRWLVLVAGLVLIAALATFLIVGKWKNPLNGKELPDRLGINIQQEANGFTYTQAHGNRTIFKIHASKVVQLKKGNALLHDVRIDLYGEDGRRVDRIEGNEFEYDQKAGTARATGAVEITLMRPGVAPAIAPKAVSEPGFASKSKAKPLATVAETAARSEIHVKTSGLTFDQKSEVAITDAPVNFSLAQGNGSSIGATFNSQSGVLVLHRAVALNSERNGETIQIHAEHGEFERDQQLCRLHVATANYRNGVTTAGEAQVQFRDDGTATQLNATNGFTMTTASGNHIAAPSGQLDFNEQNQPRHGHLEGGVTLDSTTEVAGVHRQLHSSSSVAELEFSAKGDLQHAHLVQSVEFVSEETRTIASLSERASRHWHSPLAEIEFRNAGKNAARGKTELSKVYGSGGVVILGESQRGKGPMVPSRMAADAVTGFFGPNSTLTAMTGIGHASIEQTNATGNRQSTTGDQLEAHFAPTNPANSTHPANAAELQTATVEGRVVLLEQPADKPGTPSAATLRATAGRAVYEGTDEWLHLTLNPRVEYGTLQLTAKKFDLSQQTGDGFAHGNVKASWSQSDSGKNLQQPSTLLGGSLLGEQGPAHAVAAEAQLHRATNQATFRGRARLWQQANSITAPVIVLDHLRQTLEAHSNDAAEPVRVVLVSAATEKPSSSKSNPRKSASDQLGVSQPSVIRLRGGDFNYSEAERKAWMRSGTLASVVAETGVTTSTSEDVEAILLPSGNHADKSEVDQVIARGHVTLASEGRRGTGEQLVYTSATDEYVLTGTAAAPPRMTDPARGSVTGEALIFHGSDQSLRVEGGTRKTASEATAPK